MKIIEDMSGATGAPKYERYMPFSRIEVILLAIDMSFISAWSSLRQGRVHCLSCLLEKGRVACEGRKVDRFWVSGRTQIRLLLRSWKHENKGHVLTLQIMSRHEVARPSIFVN